MANPTPATPATLAPKASPTNAAKETATLLRKLKAIKDRSSLEARSLRRALRAIGHKGGMRTAPKGGAK
jgi:hypothetical protein